MVKMALKNYESIKGYWDAKNEWEYSTSRSKERGEGVKIANNTFIFEEGENQESYRVEYHGNTIIRYTKKGEVFLYSGGGWFTSTTKERLNIFTAYVGVYQKSGEWFVVVDDREPVEWFEGIEVSL